jgi:hypothetical protein
LRSRSRSSAGNAGLATTSRNSGSASARPATGVDRRTLETGKSGNRRLDWLYDQIAQLDEIDRALTLLLLDGFTAYQIVSRARQQQRERRFEPSLRGDLDRTISQTEYRIRMATSIVWWGLLPVWLATVLFVGVLFNLVATPPTVLILAVSVIPVGFALDILFKRRPIRNELLPLKQEFESLRRKLAESERRT